MSLFGSLYTGVSSLSAQSQATSIISNNIANVNTVGFKRSEASFESLVTTEGRSTSYSPGTVSANRLQRVTEQGPVQQSQSTTEVSISGGGFFAVKGDNENSPLTQQLYTRNGQFSEDAEGFLKNSAGYYLHGWPLDADGNLPANQGDLASTVPVDVAFLGGLTRPTSSAELAANLDAREEDKTLAETENSAVDFQRGMTVYDSLGNAQPITFEFVKTYGPMGTATTNTSDMSANNRLVNDLGLQAGETFSVESEAGGPINYEILANEGDTPANAGYTGVASVGDIINDINANLDGVSAYIGNSGELLIQRDEFQNGATNTVTITEDPSGTGGTPLSDLGFTAGTYASNDLDSDKYANGGPGDDTEYGSEDFPAFSNYPGDGNYNSRGWWNMRIRDSNNNMLSNGLVNFNRDGSLNAENDQNGNIDIELNNIDWGNGSDATQNVNIDIERLTQFSSDYSVLFSDQNGAELGLRTGVSIDDEGFVTAQFSNGATSKLYKLPMVTFANPNGLQEVSGTAYAETEESGEENLREAGSGGAGTLETATLEVSNVDLADEFSRLIVAQRAYSAGTKIINTVDTMTEELLRLR